MTATAQPVQLAPGSWTAVPERTRASFAVGNLGVAVVHGSIAVTSGSVQVDSSGRPVAVRAELDLRSVDTGNARRDADLRRPHLLDVDGHPTMTFTADDLRPAGTGWRADGRLALRGTSCPLTVTATATADGDAVHVEGAARLDRTTVGIRAPRPLIGRWVTLTVDAWLTGPR